MAPPGRSKAVIADFAAGEGDLLKTAVDRWPDSKIVAVDVDKATIRRLRRKHPDWNIGVSDFLNAQSRRQCHVLRAVKGMVDLLVLNPPFSCRGGTKVSLNIAGEYLDCSLAMAFVLIGKEYLRTDGEIRAIMPAGSAYSQKDTAARAYLNRHATVSFGEQYDRNTFSGCFPNTVLLRAKFCEGVHQEGKQKINGSSVPGLLGPVQILRGSIQMHSVCKDKGQDTIPLLHTTQLRSGFLSTQLPRIKRSRSEVTGPAVLIPRVGKPSVDKLVFLSVESRVALSDCVFALVCDSHEDIIQIYERLKREWSLIGGSFGGTGAPYLTLGKLAHALTHMGISVQTPEEANPLYVRSLEHRDL